MIIEKIWLNGRPHEQYLASVSIIIAEGPLRFCIRGMRLLDLGKERPTLAMPSRKIVDENGTPRFEDLFHPLNQPARNFLEKEIFAHYTTMRRL